MSEWLKHGSRQLSIHTPADFRARLAAGPQMAQVCRRVRPAATGMANASTAVMKMREIMKPSPITITEVTRLGEAHRLMTEHRIRHLPVVDGARVCGILSERDILRYRASTAFRDDWWRAPASAAMVASPQTAGPDDSLTEVAGRLASSQIGAMPIVERGSLLGLVTITDVLEAEVRDAMA